ncbi:MAG TPA: hypothetical protein VF831_07570 [Anaerolineales bacterium]
MCYTLTMDENQPLWVSWSQALHRWGVSDGVAAVLEGAGSLSVLAAQLLYVSQPLLSGAVSAQSFQALAQVLEDPAKKRAFVSFLREAPSSGTGA